MHYVDPMIKNLLRIGQPEGRLPFNRLDQNENQDGVPNWLFEEVMSKITPEFLSMYPEEEKVLTKYAQSLDLSAENVSFVDGSVVGMGYIIRVFGEPGKDIVCVHPTFGMYGVYADMIGMNKVSIPYENDFSFDIKKILNVICDSTSIVVLVNPSMPIGNKYAADEVKAVIQKAQQHDALVLIDEAYCHFCESNCISFVEEFDNVVILRTFSKMFSIPGLRVGSIISSKDNIQYINNAKPPYSVNCVALAFVEAIVDNKERLISELDKKFYEAKAYLLNTLNEKGYSFIPTEGCFVCIWPKNKTAREITDALANRGILIFCGKGGTEGMLRVTIWSKEHLRSFIDALLEIDVA